MPINPLKPLIKDPFKYRARGKYKRTKRDSFLTTVWRSTPQEAQRDIAMFGTRHTNLRVITKRKSSLKHSW